MVLQHEMVPVLHDELLSRRIGDATARRGRARTAAVKIILRVEIVKADVTASYATWLKVERRVSPEQDEENPSLR